MSDFKFPAAGPRVLVQNCVVESNEGTLSMNSAGAHAGGYVNVGPRTATLRFEVLLRDFADMNPLLQYVRQYGGPSANVSDQTILLEDLRATAAILKDENDRLLTAVDNLQKIKVPDLNSKLGDANARIIALQKEVAAHDINLSLLRVENKYLKDPLEALAISVVRSWCIALTRDGKFDQLEIRNLVERFATVLGMFRNANYMPPIEPEPSTKTDVAAIPDDAPLF